MRGRKKEAAERMTVYSCFNLSNNRNKLDSLLFLGIKCTNKCRVVEVGGGVSVTDKLILLLLNC